MANDTSPSTLSDTARLYFHLRHQGWTPAAARGLAAAGGMSGDAGLSLAMFRLARPAKRTSTERGEVTLTTTVPVHVVVDLDTGQVIRVVVDDENVSPDYLSDDAETEAGSARARRIAERAAWPGWDSGW